MKTLNKVKKDAEHHLQQETTIFERLKESWAINEEHLKNTIANLKDKSRLQELEGSFSDEKAVTESAYVNVVAGAAVSPQINTTSMEAKLSLVNLKF
jgi:hypothetical protein